MPTLLPVIPDCSSCVALTLRVAQLEQALKEAGVAIPAFIEGGKKKKKKKKSGDEGKKTASTPPTTSTTSGARAGSTSTLIFKCVCYGELGITLDRKQTSFTANCPAYGDDAIDASVSGPNKSAPRSAAIALTASHVEVQGRGVAWKIPVKSIRFAGVGRRKKGGFFTLARYKGGQPVIMVFKCATDQDAEGVVSAMAKAVGGRMMSVDPVVKGGNAAPAAAELTSLPVSAPDANAVGGAGVGSSAGGGEQRRSSSIETAKGTVKQLAAKAMASLRSPIGGKDGNQNVTKTQRKSSLFRKTVSEPPSNSATPAVSDEGIKEQQQQQQHLYKTLTPLKATKPGALDQATAARSPSGDRASPSPHTSAAAAASGLPGPPSAPVGLRKTSWTWAGPPALHASQGCVLTACHLIKVEMPKFHKAMKSPTQMNSRMETAMKKAVNGLGGASTQGTAVLVAVSRGLLTVDADDLSLLRIAEEQARSIRYIACSQLHLDCFGIVLGSTTEQRFAMHIFRCTQGHAEAEAAVHLLGRALGVFAPLDLSERIQTAPTRRASGVEVLTAACGFRGWSELLSTNSASIQSAVLAALERKMQAAAKGRKGLNSSLDGGADGAGSDQQHSAGGSASFLRSGSVSIKGRSSIYITQKQTKASKQGKLPKGGGGGRVGDAFAAAGAGKAAPAAVPSLRIDAKDVVLCTTVSDACVLVVRTTAANTSGKDARGRVRKVKAVPAVPGVGTCTCLVVSCPDPTAADALAARLQSIVMDSAWATFETAGASHAGIGKLHNALYQQHTEQPEGSVATRLQQQTVPASLISAVEDLVVSNLNGLNLDRAAENCAAISALARYAPHCFADRVIDGLGFTIPSTAVGNYTEYIASADVAAQSTLLATDWVELEASFGLVSSASERQETTAMRFFWKGIPKERRVSLWVQAVDQRRQLSLLNPASNPPSRSASTAAAPTATSSSSAAVVSAAEATRAMTGSYKAALALVDDRLCLSSPEREQIQKDIPRTFAGTHSRFGKSAVQGSLLTPLSNVLEAHSAAKGRQCYWQGMSFVAGFLLLIFDGDEVKAFHTFSGMVDLGLVDALGDDGPKVEIDVFNEIVSEKLPALASHCLELGVPTQAFSTEWFMCAFTVTFPSVTVARLFDVIFMYMLGAPAPSSAAGAGVAAASTSGSCNQPVRGIDVLHLAGLSFLQMNQRELLQTSDPAEFTTELKRLACSQFDHNALFAKMESNCTKGGARSSNSSNTNADNGGGSGGSGARTITAALYDSGSEWTHYMSRKRRRVENDMSLEVKRSERLKQLEQLFEEHSAGEGRAHVIAEEAFVLLCKRLAATVPEKPPTEFETLARQYFYAAGDGKDQASDKAAFDAAPAPAADGAGAGAAGSIGLQEVARAQPAPPLRYTQFLVACQTFPYLRKVIELAPLSADGSSRLGELKDLFDLHAGASISGTLDRSQVYDLVCDLSTKPHAKGFDDGIRGSSGGGVGSSSGGVGGGGGGGGDDDSGSQGGGDRGGGQAMHAVEQRSRAKTMSWPGRRPSTKQKKSSDATVDADGRVLRRGRSSTVVSDHRGVVSGRRGSLSADPRLLEANKIFELAASNAGKGARGGSSGSGSAANESDDEDADELTVSWEGLLRSAGHVPSIAAWLAVSTDHQGSSVSSVGNMGGAPAVAAAAAAAAAAVGGGGAAAGAGAVGDAALGSADMMFLCYDEGQNFSAQIVATKVAASGSRLKRGRIEYVVEVRTEFADQRSIVRAFEHFNNLFGTLVEMRENGELPEADDEMIDMVELPAKPLTSSASQAAIMEHRTAIQQLLDTMQCLKSPVARRLCSDFVLLDADQLKEMR